jgi:hypothetical protein
LEKAKLALAWREAERDVASARLELRRAEAVAAGGQLIDLGVYQEALARADAAVIAKRTALDTLSVAP